MSKIKLRLSSIFIILASLVYVDEIIKEGYGFDPLDLLSPSITHEKIFIVLLALGLFFGWRKRRK
jgi:hypothetical protein